ncbi:MAG: Crp/Fnr family transcriptional regulator [Oscillospiraceae bacterium]|nr:Crp/Fnr family transcriptional regulator [Oscillospiraceae bacterium]
MRDVLQILKQSELFKTLPEEVIERDILPLGQILKLARKHQFIVPHQDMTAFAVVLSGRIHIEYSLPFGGSTLQRVATCGDILGAEWICSDQMMTSQSAEAVSAATVISFPNQMIAEKGMIDEDCRQELLNRLLRLLSENCIGQQYHYALLSLNGLRERVVMYLMRMADHYRCKIFEIPLSREEMAEILCVNRSCLSHELSMMEKDGLISFHKNQFTLHDYQSWQT